MLQKSITIPAPSMEKELILATCYSALKSLDWKIKYGVANVIIAQSPRSWKTYGEDIKIEVGDNELTVTSIMDHGEMMDIAGKNKKRLGIVHLLLNMYALYIIGSYLEPMLGKLRYGVAYVCTGLIASMASLMINDVVSAGASGAIFGMYGLFLAFLTTDLIDSKTRKALLQSIGIFVAYNLIYGFKPDSGVDNAAHLGGLVSGFIFGYVYLPSIRNKKNLKLKTSITISIALATMLAIYFGMQTMS